MAKDLYVIRKYVYAKSAKEAIKLERECPVNDCYMHDVWLNQKIDVKISNKPLNNNNIKPVGYQQ